MNDVAIRVDNLGKRYRIGGQQESSRLFSERLLATLKRPFCWRRQPAVRPDEFLWALRKVNFEVKAGEVVGVIGRNGAGKSTLLKLLSRITAPTEGRAEIRGRLGSLLEVGTGFHPELTGRENIFLNGAILGMRRAEIRRKFDEIVAFAEIDRLLDTPVKRYSSGMYVRLAFAVAAHLQPEILLIDEVLAVGDAAFQKKCLGTMGALGREGRTVLLISHNMPSIINLCQRAVLLNSGETVADGAPAEVVRQYLNLTSSVGGTVVWEDPAQAPGNDLVRLHAVAIYQEGIQGPTADVDISREVEIRIAYWHLQPGTQLYSALWIKDQLDTFVLASANAPSMSLTPDPWYGKPHPPGLFQSICRIPGNLLNEGSYHITAFVGKVVSTPLVQQERVLTFHVHDTGEMRKEYLGPWVGPVIRPKLAWQTERIEGQIPEKQGASVPPRGSGLLPGS